MRRASKILLLVIVPAIVIVGLSVTPDTDADAMKIKYGGQHLAQAPDGFGGLIHYRDSGGEDLTPLLFIHGSSGSLHVWEEMTSELSETYRVISFDQHGHGLTGPHGERDYSAQARISAAIRLLDHLKINSAVWIGNSMGGWVAWRAALAKPGRVEKLVLINAAGVMDLGQPQLAWAARLSRSWFGRLLMPIITPRFMVASATRNRFGDANKVSDQMIDRFWELMRYPGNRQASVDDMDILRPDEHWAEIDQIEVPTLILWGADDVVFPLPHAHAFHDEIIGSELRVYPGAGHLPMLEVPKEIAADIDAWLNK